MASTSPRIPRSHQPSNRSRSISCQDLNSLRPLHIVFGTLSSAHCLPHVVFRTLSSPHCLPHIVRKPEWTKCGRQSAEDNVQRIKCKGQSAEVVRAEIQFVHSRGSVILPVNALAATVAGEARKTCDSVCPIRPGKFRLVALIQMSGVFMLPKVSTGPPRQAAQPAFSVICTPAS